MFLDGETDVQHRARLRRLSAAVPVAFDTSPDLSSLKPAAAEEAMDLLESRYDGLAELIKATKVSADALALMEVLEEVGAPRHERSVAEHAYSVAAQARTQAWSGVKAEGDVVRKLLESHARLAAIAGQIDPLDGQVV